MFVHSCSFSIVSIMFLSADVGTGHDKGPDDAGTADFGGVHHKK